MSELVITLTDQIPSGKNAIRIAVNHGKVYKYPDQRFTLWRQAAAKEILTQKRKWTIVQKMKLPLLGPLRMTVSYRELAKVPAGGTRDLTGMMDALFHLLEHCEIVQNDGQIKAAVWEWPWRTDGPCAIIKLEVL